MNEGHRRIVLVGAGHAHVEVLRQWSLSASEHERTLVVDRNPAIYSGMVPGFVAGQYDARELEIDAVALARRAGARIVMSRAVGVEAGRDRILCENGEIVPYDVASLDVGSRVRGLSIPGVAEHALTARPIERFVAGANAALAHAGSADDATPRVLVVGAGAGGVELAFCFDARLGRARGASHPPKAPAKVSTSVTLIDRSEAALAGSAPALARRVRRALARRGIGFLRGEVASLDERGARLTDGSVVGADVIAWAPGPAAHPFLADTDLPVDDGGFVRIRPTLQVVGFDRLFAAGDCASLDGMKRAGVYAVRAGPVLAENLARAIVDEPLRRFAPQRDFLSLLNLGDGTAVGAKWGFAFEGRWVMILKDRIDRRFIARYQ